MKKLVLLFITCLMVIACEREVKGEGYPEMESFYTESCGLPAVTKDSIKLFTIKVNNYTTEYPESKEHSLYPKIQENITTAMMSITIECDTTWDGETHINF